MSKQKLWIALAIACCTAIIIFLSVGYTVDAHTIISTNITWSREVSRIVYKNCASCHHDGGSSFSLMTYDEARPWAEDIKDEVLDRQMPPWNAVEGFGDFRNDRGLTQEDIEIIAAWVVGGAPEGDPAYLPKKPEFGNSIDDNPAPGDVSRFAVSGSAVVPHSVRVIGIEPKIIPDTGELQVVAVRPDGSIEPLLWVRQFNPKYKGTYYYRDALSFPAGTKIQIAPQAGGVALLLARATGTPTHAVNRKTGAR